LLDVVAHKIDRCLFEKKLCHRVFRMKTTSVLSHDHTHTVAPPEKHWEGGRK